MDRLLAFARAHSIQVLDSAHIKLISHYWICELHLFNKRFHKCATFSLWEVAVCGQCLIQAHLWWTFAVQLWWSLIPSCVNTCRRLSFSKSRMSRWPYYRQEMSVLCRTPMKDAGNQESDMNNLYDKTSDMNIVVIVDRSWRSDNKKHGGLQTIWRDLGLENFFQNHVKMCRYTGESLWPSLWKVYCTNMSVVEL